MNGPVIGVNGLITANAILAASSTTGLDPWSSPQLHDEIDIAGLTLAAPGDCWFQITGAERAYRWDVKDGAGLQGAIETYRGRTPPPFQITFYMWTPQHWVSVTNLFASLQYDPTKLAVKAYPIFHVALSILGISQVIVEGIGLPAKVGDWQSGPDMFTAVLKLREFYPILPIPPQTPDQAALANQPPQLSPDIQNQQNIQNQLTQQIRNAGDPLGLITPPAPTGS
jgi:hypothetical protein